MSIPKNIPLIKTRKIGIRYKFIGFFCLSTLILIFVGMGAGYFQSEKLLHNAIGDDYEKIAENLSISTSGLLDMLIEHIKVHLTNSIHNDVILEANKKYAGKNENRIKKYLLGMDKKWIPAAPESALVNQYTHSSSSKRLNAITKTNKYIAELFVTDKFGGIAAISGKTSDFYQADEEWWQKAYNNGEGAFYISNIEYDQSSKTISIAIAIPIRDAEGQLIGIGKAVVTIKHLFETIENFKINKTGQAVLVDNQGNIICHPEQNVFAHKFCDPEEFTKIINNQDHHPLILTSKLHNGKLFSAFAVVNNPYLFECGITWRIFIIEDPEEVFAIAKHVIITMALIFGLLIILLIPSVLIFAQLFINPLIKLRTAVEHFRQGDFNYPLNIKTNDEIEWLANSFKNMSEKLSGMLNSLQKEITAHKLTENSLKILEENYRTIFESANDAVVIRDPDTYKIVEANQKASEMFGYSQEQLSGLNLDSFNGNDEPGSLENLKSFFRKAAEKKPQIFEWLVKDNLKRKFWVESSVKCITIRNKNYFISMIRDITERKQLLEQKENFMSTVSHELRIPLAAIKESVALSLEDSSEVISPRQKELLTIAKNNVNRLTRLINQVLDIQKIGLGLIKLNLQETDINELIKDAHRNMASLASKKNVNFTLQLDNHLPKAKFDREKITGAIANLIGNALKFTKEGTITITSGLKDNFIQVSVRDTGIGISKEDMPKLFQRFVQLKRSPGGSGLGLYICKETIELHHGKIWAESEEGKGATFYFTLPLSERG